MSNREIVLDLVNQLPPDTALTDIARRLEFIAADRAEYEPPDRGERAPLADVFQKWRGRGRLPVGRNTDEYLGMIRDGDSR